jgi:hypothetical protein
MSMNNEPERERRLLLSDFSSYWDSDKNSWCVISQHGICATGFKTQREADDYILGDGPDAEH